MKWFYAMLFLFSGQVFAQSCPKLGGVWAAPCNGYLVRIHLMQVGCDKFIYNEYDQKSDGSMGPGARLFTLDKATLYKTNQSGHMDKAYRRAELDSSGKKLTLNETHMWESGPPVEVRKTTFVFNDDQSLDFSFENYNLTGEEMTNTYSCPQLPRLN